MDGATRGGARGKTLNGRKERRSITVHIEEKGKQNYCKKNKTVRSKNVKKVVAEQISLKGCRREQKKYLEKIKGFYRTILIADFKYDMISSAVIIEGLDKRNDVSSKK